MLIGNPDRFAFLIERVPEWESDNFINGIMYVYLNGVLYPDALRTTTINVVLHYLFNSTMPDMMPAFDKTLFQMENTKLFKRLCEMTFAEEEEEENDYSYQIPLLELEDAGYVFFFAVAFEESIRILVGYSEKGDPTFVDEIEISLDEYESIKKKLFDYYINDILDNNKNVH